MNFKQFYNNSEQRIIDTILSLWSTGDGRMQEYLKDIFKEEKLLAKPVFQNMFPWEPSSKKFKDLDSLFNAEFIQKLDGISNPEYRFPKERNPYLHQVKSWNSALNDKKSILVTTGTGSGKTECFMLPVLYDIFQHNPNANGINAIFLYPLNALIGSQKKRMHEWCKSLGNINYAVYNGNTKNSVPANTQHTSYPEIVSRKGIRENPPQILFTNPTMLEYMLVRDKDTQLLENSQGKLRWILLDEAHTLTGSKAAEMALLIRRVIDAFGVDVNNVRFAVTSATVGSGKDDSLKQFMSDLCGINTSQIEVISGNKILPEFDSKILKQNNLQEKISVNLRKKLFEKGCIDEKDIELITEIKNLNEQLSFIDKISELEDSGKPILPIRGHFFVRNINGLYACTNPACKIHPNMPDYILGSLTTIAKKNCECGYPLLELISCRTCGTFMMEGEK
ncbi:MAG: DEAD/DEAH box helicase [Bacteroidetes bacterium]|nr:DEAD/DEAH box helicase [Bacteroidota bacterium]